ncbi:MAG TPA: hypothetical protein VGP47_08810 [Parachlamydiaceae bacterium]|nr:hypothetical protein [Parachlamydiaceae bacterium]
MLATTLAIAEASPEDLLIRFAIGALSGTVFGGVIISLDMLFKNFNLRTFNTAIIGLFAGYLMGSALLIVIQSILDISVTQLESRTLLALQASVFLTACYFGMVMTARASNELYASIPFIRFKTSNKVKKDILIDASALSDPRTIDLAVSGLLDQNLVIPRFLLKELHEQADSLDEGIRLKARRCLDTNKKLEAIPTLELRYAENNITEIHDIGAKLNRLARQLDASILTADSSRTQSTTDSVRYININSLSNSMKPLAQNGESLNIKIQRYGKEPRQGVGYLEDGTMVVVNGGADYIGATIRAQVLSVKHTTSGRMIFCNAADSDFSCEPAHAGMTSDNESTPSNYFTT